MRREPAPFSRRGEVLGLVLCTVMSLILIILPSDSRILVADRLGHVLTGPYWSFRLFLADVGTLRAENNALQHELAVLELQAATHRRGQRDVGRLAGPALDPGYAGDLVPCRVVMRQSSRFANMVKVRSPQPVPWRQWQPVVSRAGYLGRLRTVISPTEAWVELMTAPDFALGVEFERTGLLGILRPRAGSVVVEMVGRDEDVLPGDRVVTSGITEIREGAPEGTGSTSTPRGFPVGLVRSARSPNDQVFKEIVLVPSATMDQNVTVFVVTSLEATGPVGGGVQR